jgi:hypothetical protein
MVCAEPVSGSTLRRKPPGSDRAGHPLSTEIHHA